MSGSHDTRSRDSERGSALVIAILVTVIIALLGISFLMMGDTENRIAENEKLAAQALYAAESGARLVKQWFDYPGVSLHFPTEGVVERRLRRIIDESDPYDPADVVSANGTTEPWYKQGVDLDEDLTDDLFDRPYRVGKLHSLLGTESGPDIRIDDGVTAAADFLRELSETLLADFPAGAAGIHARISRIDIFAPPYVKVGTNWSRYGMGTVKVVARIYRGEVPGARVMAEREVRMVLSEIPYYGPFGPLHSCGDLTFTGAMGAHWGLITATGEMKLSDPPAVPTSLPREQPGAPRIDPLWNTSDPSLIANLVNAMDSSGVVIPDPWFRTLSGEELDLPTPPGPAVQPFAPDPSTCCDSSNLIQNLPILECPEFDYRVFKSLATSGAREAHYYKWAGGATFSEDGVEDPESFQDITNGAEGVYFFDTADGLPPEDTNGVWGFDNLTDPIVLDGTWSFRGFLYLNARSIELRNVTGGSVTFEAPGEPFQDANQNGRHDLVPTEEAWINLAYPSTLSGSFTVNKALGSPLRRDERGPAITAQAAFEGMLFTNGKFEATGRGTVYGSVLAHDAVVQAVDDGSAPTPDIYWDESIVTGWPPEGWELPRVVITGWITER